MLTYTLAEFLETAPDEEQILLTTRSVGGDS